MRNFALLKSKLSTTQRICITGLFIALTAIFQKITAINYLPFAPFLRLSIGGPALIIFSSIFLGPIYGMLVGAASDLLGFFLFDPKLMGGAPYFQITAIYALLGFLSYYVFNLVMRLKNKKVMTVIQIITYLLLLGGITAFFLMNSSFEITGTVYEITPLIKILVPCFAFILLAGLLAFTFIFRKKAKCIFDPLVLTFALFFIELIVMVIFGVFMKATIWGFNIYIALLVTQVITMFFNICINTIVLNTLFRISKKHYEVKPLLEVKE